MTIIWVGVGLVNSKIPLTVLKLRYLTYTLFENCLLTYMKYSKYNQILPMDHGYSTLYAFRITNPVMHCNNLTNIVNYYFKMFT